MSLLMITGLCVGQKGHCGSAPKASPGAWPAVMSGLGPWLITPGLGSIFPKRQAKDFISFNNITRHFGVVEQSCCISAVPPEFEWLSLEAGNQVQVLGSAHNQSLERCNNDRNSWKFKFIGDIFALMLEVSQRGTLPAHATQTTSLSCNTDFKCRISIWYRRDFALVTCQKNQLHPKLVGFIVEHPFSP